jgi:hypothetical protein
MNGEGGEAWDNKNKNKQKTRASGPIQKPIFWLMKLNDQTSVTFPSKSSTAAAEDLRPKSGGIFEGGRK